MSKKNVSCLRLWKETHGLPVTGRPTMDEILAGMDDLNGPTKSTTEARRRLQLKRELDHDKERFLEKTFAPEPNDEPI